jgi:hypothetical protein
MDDDNSAMQVALYRRIIAMRLVPAEVRAVAAQLLTELERKAAGPSVQVRTNAITMRGTVEAYDRLADEQERHVGTMERRSG